MIPKNDELKTSIATNTANISTNKTNISKITGTKLYTKAFSSGSITISSLASYSRLKFYDSTGNFVGEWINLTSNAVVHLHRIYAGSVNLKIYAAVLTIDTTNKKITVGENYQISYNTETGALSKSTTDIMSIQYVVGYKNL